MSEVSAYLRDELAQSINTAGQRTNFER